MKRLAIFAHWDKDNLIEDYVLYYLQKLKKVADIIFVSDGDIEVSELSKIKEITNAQICIKHGEYDFGSYKRGFLYACENNFLENVDEVIFTNDSCYGPLLPLENIFNEMEKKDIDFWGALESNYGLKRDGNKIITTKDSHLQSYFLVFRKNVFNSDCFLEFMKSIKKQEDKIDVIINYEIGITKALKNAGFNYEAYGKSYPEVLSLGIIIWDKLIKEGHPFLKTSILRLKNTDLVFPFGWQKLLKKYSEYPLDLIEKDLKRNKEPLSFKFFKKTVKGFRKSFKAKLKTLFRLGF